MATANTRRNKEAPASDLYTTPAWAVASLLNREDFTGSITDAGCGKGDISTVLLATGHKDVISVDLYDWGYGQTGIDYLEYDTLTENTMSNPPFKILQEFILQALKLSKRKVAIFARVSALESQARYLGIYKDNPPSRVYQFVNRVKCLRGGHDDGESSSVSYCWLIWDFENPTDQTQFLWIEDKCPKDERPKFDINAPAVHVNDSRFLVDEALTTFRSIFNDGEDRKHICSVSGGKDSTITYALASMATEGNYRAICCDTDNEKSETYDYIRDLHNNVGEMAQPVELYKLEIPESRFESRRIRIQEKWRKPHVIKQGKYEGEVIPPMTEEQIQTALSVTKKTGNAFVDLCVIHGSMPTRQARFCTNELKIAVATEQVLLPALDEFDGEVINWSGVRAQESEKRSKYKWLSEDPRGDGFLFTFLPIHQWTVEDVFAVHKYLGIKPNPLYIEGATRVGCWPCFMSNKAEIRQLAQNPEQIARLDEWEKIVTLTNRYSYWRAEKEGIPFEQFRTGFFNPRNGMVGASVHDVVSWAMTDRAGDPIEYDGSMMNCQLGDHIFCE